MEGAMEAAGPRATFNQKGIGLEALSVSCNNRVTSESPSRLDKDA